MQSSQIRIHEMTLLAILVTAGFVALYANWLLLSRGLSTSFAKVTSGLGWTMFALIFSKTSLSYALDRVPVAWVQFLLIVHGSAVTPLLKIVAMLVAVSGGASLINQNRGNAGKKNLPDGTVRLTASALLVFVAMGLPGCSDIVLVFNCFLLLF